MEINSKYRVDKVENIIRNIFSFLEKDYSYSSSSIKDNSDNIMKTFDIKFSNEIIRREIIISYTEIEIDTTTIYSFNLGVGRLPYSGVEDYLSLSTYLSSLGKSFPMNIENDWNEITANEILAKLGESLKYYLNDVILGDIWLEKYYTRW